MNAMQRFSDKGAKIVAGAVARFAVGWVVAKLVAYGVLSATWAADPQHMMMAAMIIMGVIYEIEEMVWQKWGLDIPGALEKIGVPLMQATLTEVPVAPSTPPQAQPSLPPATPVEPTKIDPPKA